MPRRNRTNRAPQSRRTAWFDMPEFVPPREPLRSTRPKLLPMVASKGQCPTGKIRYGNPDDAAEALRRALINREILQSPVVEERWYPQPGDAPCICSGYHLTSAPRRTK